MNRLTLQSVLGVTVLTGAGAVLLAIWRSPPLDAAVYETALQLVRQAVAVSRAAIASGYLKSPEIILVLGGVLLIPVMALLGGLLRFTDRLRRRQLDAEHAAARAVNAGFITSPMSRAWLAVDGRPLANANHEIKGEILRIGRDSDNDLSLADDSVQQFHAVIRRTLDAEFLIIDVGGKADLLINGRTMPHARLRSGDRIALGHTEVVFHRAMQPPLGIASNGSSAVH